MARFEVHYRHEIDYDDRIVLEIKLRRRPSKEDYQSMLTAIETLDKLREKYLEPAPVIIKKGVK